MAERPVFNHFDLPSLVATMGSLPCVNGHYNAIFMGPYRSSSGDLKYARLSCSSCGADIYVNDRPYIWMPSPALPEKQKKQRRTAHLPSLGTDFCWICNLDTPTLLNLGMAIQYAHPIDRAAALDAGRDPMDDLTFPVCTYHHRWIDNERAQYAKILNLLGIAGAVSAIGRPMLPDAPKDLP